MRRMAANKAGWQPDTDDSRRHGIAEPANQIGGAYLERLAQQETKDTLRGKSPPKAKEISAFAGIVTSQVN
jgi:hypothetical protein